MIVSSSPTNPTRTASSGKVSPIRSIVRSYDDLIIRLYSSIRFLILRQPFLEDIDRHLPSEGRILDLGSGFGLFSLYFASTGTDRELIGVDMNEGRVEQARRSAEKLGLDHVHYHVGDVLEWEAAGEFDAIYMLDVIHHLPKEYVPEFLGRLRSLLKPDGILIIKEVADRPLLKMWFTMILDRLMVGLTEPIHYWSPPQLVGHLEGLGLEVEQHRMHDFLPYPHILYICRTR